MENKEIEISGRKYEVKYSPDMPAGAFIIIGPPEEMIDQLWISRGLPVPEPFATNLHNILYDRRIYTYKDIASKNAATGVLQEALNIEAHLLTELFLNYEKETV